MVLDQTANFVRDSLSSSVASGDSSITVTDGSIFPDPANGEYQLVVWDSENNPRPGQDPDVEVMRATAISTDTITVSRGQENTSAVSHPSGGAVQMAPTAKLFSDIDTAIQNAGSSITTVGRNINNLTQEVARTQFDIGLSELSYDTGLYDRFTNLNKVSQRSNVEIKNDSLVLFSERKLYQETLTDDKSLSQNVEHLSQRKYDGCVYAALSGGNFVKVDLADLSVVDTYSQPSSITMVQIDPGNGTGYFTTQNNKFVKVDLDNMTFLDSDLDYGSEYSYFGLDRAGGYGYHSVSNGANDNTKLKKINLSSMSETGVQYSNNFPTTAKPQPGPNGDYLYWSIYDSWITKFDTSDLTDYDQNSEIEQIPFYVFNTEEKGLWPDDNTLRLYDLTDLSEIGSVNLGRNMKAIHITNNDEYFFTWSSSTNRVYQVKLSNMTVENDRSVSNIPDAASSIDDYLYASISGDISKRWKPSPPKTNGFALTPFKDIDIVPDKLVIGHDATLPSNTTLKYEVEDDAGNVETFTESEVDAEVELPSISTSNVRTTLVLDRDSSSDPTPEINSYALYLSE